MNGPPFEVFNFCPYEWYPSFFNLFSLNFPRFFREFLVVVSVSSLKTPNPSFSLNLQRPCAQEAFEAYSADPTVTSSGVIYGLAIGFFLLGRE